MKRTWKNFASKTAAKILAAALTVTACLSGVTLPVHAAGYGKDGVVRDMTSQQIVEDMGLGYNIGNTFDSLGSFIPKGDPWDYQKGWGNEPVSKHFIQKVKAAGFKTIRFPVSWAQWIDDNHQIDPGYMNAVQTVVDWCMEEDLYVILNMHHDSGAGDTSWVRKAATDWEWTSRRYESAWTQIANNFKNYGDHLIFEGMNEVEFPDAPNMSRQYEILNAMNQLFVDSVRKTGGNNGTRHLLIPGYNTNIERSCDRRYQMPSDPAGHCILSIHYYSPSPFCVAEHNVDWAVPLTSWGSEEDIRAVEADFDILAKNYLSKGIPVIIGEYGVLTEDQKEKSSIQAYVSKVPELILEYGMCPVLWDTSNAGDMKFIERVSGDFYDPVIRDNYLALSQKRDAGQITRRQFDYPEYKRVSVKASPEGWVSLAAYQPENILGVAFEMACSSDWDSYGGGGIYIDSWDNTIEYQFNSIYDEIVHIFTEDEKARLKDQISVAIWWTDESKGGSHRDELSLKDGRVTLLYGEDANPPSTGSSSGTGSGGSGTKSPSHQADPSGDGNGGSGGSQRYEYVLTKDRNNVPDDDQETGIQKLDLNEICPGYQVGDKVRLTLSLLSDGGYSFAVTTNYFAEQSKSWAPSDGKTVSWECTPSDGLVFVRLWYLGGNYLMFNVKAEVTEKAPRIEGFDVEDDPENEGGYSYDLENVYETYGIRAGGKVKLTVFAEETADGAFAQGEVWFTDENGARVSGDIGPESASATLIGTPKDGKLIFDLQDDQEARTSAAPSLRVSNIKAEELEDSVALAELQGKGRVEIDSSLVSEKEGREQGYKIYFEFDGDIHDPGAFSGNLVVDGDWSYGNADWVIREDGQETYIWYPSENSSNVVIACWYSNGTAFKVNRVERVIDPEAAFAAFEVTKDQPVVYDLSQLKEKAGIPEGSRVKVTVSAKGEKAFSGEALAEDANGNTVTGFMPDGGTTVIGNIDEMEFRVVNGADEGEAESFEPYTVEDLKVEEAQGEALGEFQSAGRIEFDQSLIEKKVDESAQESGLKVYYECEKDAKDISSNLIVNGDWSYGNSQYVTGTDEDGKYIWYSTDSVDSVMVACWYVDSSWKITKLTEIAKNSGEDPTPDQGPELGENEIWIKADENGEYHNPAGKPSPSGLRFTMKGENPWGANISVNGEYWGWKASGEEHKFDEGMQVEYVTLVAGDNTEIEYVVFIYSEDEPTPPEEDDPTPPEEDPGPELGENEVWIKADENGEYHNPAGKPSPSGLRFTMKGENPWGANISVNGEYWGWKAAGEEHEFDEGVKVEYVTLESGEGAEVEYVVFIYSEDEPTPPEEDDPTPPEEDPGPELGENEVWIKADENGEYHNPSGKPSPTSLRFTMKGENPWGTNVSVNGEYWGWKAAGEEHEFDEGVEVEYVTLESGEGAEVEYVVFIYSEDEPTPPEEDEPTPPEEDDPTPPEEDPGPELGENEVWIKADENGEYHNPSGKPSPISLRFTMKGENPWGTNVSVNGEYWGWKAAGEEHKFDEGVEVEYVTLESGEGAEVEYVIFIYDESQTPVAEREMEKAGRLMAVLQMRKREQETLKPDDGEKPEGLRFKPVRTRALSAKALQGRSGDKKGGAGR